MTEIVIKDVPVKFPFTPYKVQEDYMQKVLECLQEGVNGVLESPTGTGKTLSLLCSSLAWLQIRRAQQQATAHGLLSAESQDSFNKTLQQQLQKSAGAASESQDGTWSKMLSAPFIVYATRTHSQLTQVMKELKRTSYSHVKATVLGSRDQLCLHPDLAEEQGFMKMTLCRAKMKAKSCHYYNNLDAKRNSGDKTFMPPEVTDIEDLMKLGHKSQCCPYFMARELMAQADIVFMPYNYLLDPQTRRAQKITLNNAVVILDEAHNVEKTCEEAASISISSTEIALCIADVTQAMKKYAEIEKMNFESSQDISQDFSMEELCVLKSMFLALETAVDEIEIGSSSNTTQKAGRTFPGSYIFDILGKAEIVMSKLLVLDECLTRLAQFISTTSDSPISRKGNSLLRFNEFLKVVHESCAEGGKSLTDLYYKVHIEQEMPKKGKPDSWSSAKTNLDPKAKVINFWCFSPGFAMRSLQKQGVHCVILTSGTLAPLQATISELGIPVPVTLENPHIIQSNQVSVAVLSKGPTGEKLVSNYTNRENPKYMGDLGGILKNFCRVIPDGILVFFASYPTMSKTIDYWQQQGHWSQITALKPLFVEPQRRDTLAEVLRDYQAAVEAEGSRGAVLLAVLRGKVSEGMDFADAQARAVLVTGLPYPPFKDPRVVLKQEYLDSARKNNSQQGLTGRQWYELDAVRAVNQAVGRVIRHASDFGAILLCDCRFSSPSVTATISAWLRSQIVPCKEFGQAYGTVSRFFKAMGLKPPTKPVPVGASFDYVEGKVRSKESTSEKPVKDSSQAALSEMKFFEKFRTGETKQEVQPPPKNLLEALNAPISTTKPIDIMKSVYEDTTIKVKESYVQPAPKKRKLRLVPLKFDLKLETHSETSNATEATTSVPDRTKGHIEYLSEVKKRISAEDYNFFKEVVKSYAKVNEANYDKTMMCLRKVFPDSSTKDLFINFQRYIRKEHRAQFQDLCFRMFGSTS